MRFSIVHIISSLMMEPFCECFVNCLGDVNEIREVA